jgi:hypothetical protein
MKLSKAQTKKHNIAMDLVESDKPLTIEQKIEVLKNYHPGASHNVTWNAAFFTPPGLARDMCIELRDKANKRTLDLCAGIGMLSFYSKLHQTGWGAEDRGEYVCIENNPEFVEVGKKIMPEAMWLRADVFDVETYSGLGRFDEVISNPPYGLKPEIHPEKWLYNVPSQYMVAEIAMKVSNYGVFILAQGDLPFKFSNTNSYQEVDCAKYNKFHSLTGINFEMNCGLDTGYYSGDWNGLQKMVVEVVLVSKSEDEEICLLSDIDFRKNKLGKKS